MNILIYCPMPAGSTRGNQITADRWANIIAKLGHNAAVITSDKWQSTDRTSIDVLIALHARKSSEIIEEFHQADQSKPIIVALTGTDLHCDLKDPDFTNTVFRSLETATQIVMLEPESIKLLPTHLYSKVGVIVQSAIAVECPEPADESCFEVSVLGHLRDIKDPFLTAKATKLLPASSKIKIVHAGEALSQEMKSLAESETQSNPRYEWIGPVSHQQAQQILARSRLTVLTSKHEGGASVLSEAIVNRTPILITRISAATSLLGDEYPGLFEVGDANRLCELMSLAETNEEFYRSLINFGQKHRDLFSLATEESKWQQLLSKLHAK